ncbi:hypothetical protein CJO74_14320 [Ralstonia solanacearum]|nr:hypothetical protein CJO74_14320 [Ralstonia solanacearum]
MASALAALALTACSGRVLDYRNMTVSGGKIYAQNSDTPFSGKVTNVPFGEAVENKGPFKFIYNVANAARETTADTFGVVGNTICDLTVKNGYRDGDAVCRDEHNGTKYYELAFKEGRIAGDVQVYSTYSNGKPIATGTIGDKGIEGKVKGFNAKDHALIYKGDFTDGVNQSSEDYYADTGKVKRTYVFGTDGRVNGPVVTYSQEGKRISYGIPAAMNGESLVYNFYPDTGKIKSCLLGFDSIGWTFSWDEAGALSKAPSRNDKLTFDKILKLCKEQMPTDIPNAEKVRNDLDGLLAKTTSTTAPTDPLSTPQGVEAAINGEDRTSWPTESNACTQAWESDFRKKNGTDAAIGYEMAWEWLDNCRAGKRPH